MSPTLPAAETTGRLTVIPPAAAPAPLLVSIPHTGTEVQDAIAARFASDTARSLPDTDWHLHRLYRFASELGATIVHARASRYVVDLNRPRDASPLYPGRAESALVPTETFAGDPIWRPGEEPDAAEVAARVETWWDPYHARLRAELERLRAEFGYALLFDAHSIASEVPRFFEGRLPGLVLGDADGASAAPEIIAAVRAVHLTSGLESAYDRPFRGGAITRAYGRPDEGVHALQLEMAQRLYMREGPPFAWDEERAARLRPVLRETLRAFLAAGAAIAA